VQAFADSLSSRSDKTQARRILAEGDTLRMLALEAGDSNRGAKLHEITAQLGHSSAAVTSMYLHVNPEESSSRYLAI